MDPFERQSSRESIFRESPSDPTDSVVQTQAWYCTAEAEIRGILTLSSNLFFEPDPGDLRVHQNGLGFFQIFVDFRDVEGAGAVTAPADSLPYVEEITDFRSIAFFVQVELNRLNGKSEITDQTIPVIFRVSTGREAHEFAEVLIARTAGNSGSKNFFATLTSVPFSSQAVVDQIAGVPTQKVAENFQTPRSSLAEALSDSISPEPSREEISRAQVLISHRDTAGVEWRARHEEPSFLLTSEMVTNLRHHLPIRLRWSDVTLGFSPKIHGISMQHFVKHQEFLFGDDPDLPGLLVVQDTQGKIFGAFATGRWRVQPNGRFYGSGESFVFEFVKAEEARVNDGSDDWFCTYPWTRKNELFQFVDDRHVIVGGGTTDSAVVIKEGFQFGIAGQSDTYDNPCLASTREFEIRDIEYWVLTNDD